MEEEKENKKKREKERERKRAHTGEIRGRRSRVGDKQPSGTGWNGGEEKERKRGTVDGKRRRKDGMTNEIRCWDGGSFWGGTRV